MKTKKLFYVFLACVLTFATLLGAILISEQLSSWFQSLSTSRQKLVQPILTFVSIILLALAGYQRYRHKEYEYDKNIPKL